MKVCTQAGERRRERRLLIPSMAEVRWDLRPDLLGLASREEDVDEGLEGGEGRVRSC